MSCATRKLSRVVALMKSPVSASRVANATACTRISKCGQRVFRYPKPFSISVSAATSITKVMSDPTCLASGTTRSVMRSICAKASSAPSRCIACAMPQAMERSVATPTMNARLPARNPMVVTSGVDYAGKAPADSAVARRELDAQFLSGVDARVRAEAIPGEQLGHAALKEHRDLRNGVTLAHRVFDPPPRRLSPRARGQADALSGAQGIVRVHAVHHGQRVHVHAVMAGDGPQ